MNLILPVSVKVGSSLTNADAVPLLCDPTNSFGVRRIDTGAVIAAANTSMDTVPGTMGIYTFTITDAAPGVCYEFWAVPIVNGIPYQTQRFLTAYDPESESYLSSSEVTSIIATLPGLPNCKAASSDVLTSTALLASIDVDASGPYQGRRFIPHQRREFPRMAYSGPSAAMLPIPLVYLDPWFYPGFFSGMIVWDWDENLLHALTPFKVKLATIFQMESLIAGDRDQRLQDISDGLTQQQAGGISEQYRMDANPGRLCDRAQRIMDYYLLRQGKFI